MSKRKLAAVFMTVLFFGAGAANAASVFPSSSNEVSPTGYTQSIEGLSQASTGAAGSVFPSAAIEHAVRLSRVDSTAPIAPNVVRMTSVFPSSANETGRL